MAWKAREWTSDLTAASQDIVPTIFRAFGAPEAIWYSEWTPFDSENLASFDDVAAFMASHPQLRSTELENLGFSQYFVQPITDEN